MAQPKPTLAIGDLFKDGWTQGVAISIAVLAVCAAISGLRASGYSTKVALSTTIENKNWSYFQSKSIKQHTCETELRLYQFYKIQSQSPAAMAALDDRIQFLEKEIARYDHEKESIKRDAEQSAADQRMFKKRSANFGLATMLLQICIMLSSISTLIKKKMLWAIGLVFGVAGVVYMANGFLLFF